MTFVGGRWQASEGQRGGRGFPLPLRRTMNREQFPIPLIMATLLLAVNTSSSLAILMWNHWSGIPQLDAEILSDTQTTLAARNLVLGQPFSEPVVADKANSVLHFNFLRLI